MTKVFGFLAFLALWLLFVSKLATSEILAGLAAAVIAGFAFEISKRAEGLRFRPSVAALLQVWRVPGLILEGTWILIGELARRATGHRRRSLFQLTPFRAAAPDYSACAKRALAVIYATLPPNFLIVGVDRGSHLMLYHQVRKEPVPEIIRRLESA